MKGHIRERSPGHWAIILDAKDPVTGERKRRWHSFKGTKRAAQIESARLIAERQSGGAIEPDKVTVAEFLDRFWTDWVANHVSAHSGERYSYALAPVRQHLGGRPLQKLRPADLAAFYAALAREGLAPRTIKLIHAVLHRAFDQAKNWGVIRDNPAEIAKPPKAPDRETQMLQPSEARQLLERLCDHPLYLLVSLALATGARRSEMLALRWQDVDLDARKLTIERALEETRAHGIRVKGPKTKHGYRTIALPPHVVAELRQHWREQQERRLAMGLGKAPADSPVLATPEGTYQSPDALSKAWPRIMAGVGMPAVTLHSLRHTHASMLIASGVDILTISRRLGHSSPTITLGVYGHLVHGTDDRAAQVMEAAFGSKMVAGSEGKPGK